MNYLLKLNLLLLIAIALVGCQLSTPTAKVDRSLEATRLDTQLVLNNAVLEQSNLQNNTVWKIKADNITYSEDQETARLERVVANLLEDGKIILKLSANQGEVKENGNLVILKEQIVASDPRNGSVMESDLVEWRPQENLLLITADLTGNHPNLQVTAQRGRYLTDLENLEIEGNAIATTKQPALQLTSDRLTWQIPQGKVESPGAITVVRYQQDQTVTDRLVSDRAKFDLNTNIATLIGNIELVSLQPNLQAATESLTWNYQQRTGTSDRPIQIIDRDRQITLTGNQGEIDLQQQIAKLNHGAKGLDRQQQSELYARQLTWHLDTEEVIAMGDVIYQQSDPQAKLTGDKAVGKLHTNNIVVSSEGKKPVTSIINN